MPPEVTFFQILFGSVFWACKDSKDTVYHTRDLDSVGVFSHFPSQAQTPKKKVSKVKDLPAKSPQDADKMVRIFMPDVNKNAGPERGVSTKGMNFGGMTDRQPRPPKAT